MLAWIAYLSLLSAKDGTLSAATVARQAETAERQSRIVELLLSDRRP